MVLNMSRPREFDVDGALDSAMKLFWRNGYEATSLSDLTDGLGIGKGSFYAAFESKDKLYGVTLDRYIASQAADLIQLLDEAIDIRIALRTALRQMADADLKDPELGCMLVKAATERAGDDNVSERVARAMRSVEAAVAASLERARVRGEIAASKDPAALARFFTTFVQGLRIMGSARSDQRTIDDAISVALATLN
jgi:TetR/AcrR family transcriptional regulator, transcriptional repressor for nem operon